MTRRGVWGGGERGVQYTVYVTWVGIKWDADPKRSV